MGWETFDIDLAEPLVVVGTRIIGTMVKRRRERLGLSQRRLATVVGCNQSVISRLENGKITSMRYRRFARIVGILGGLDSTDPLPGWRRPWRPPNLAWAVNSEAEWLASMPFPPPAPQAETSPPADEPPPAGTLLPADEPPPAGTLLPAEELPPAPTRRPHRSDASEPHHEEDFDSAASSTMAGSLPSLKVDQTRGLFSRRPPPGSAGA